MKKITMIFLSVFLLISAVPVKALEFWRSGMITRTLSDGTAFGECMIQLSVPIGNGCTGNWVSLDCKGGYYPERVGSKNYASAIVAASMKKQVSVYIDNSKKYNGNHCVAQRLDILF